MIQVFVHGQIFKPFGPFYLIQLLKQPLDSILAVIGGYFLHFEQLCSCILIGLNSCILLDCPAGGLTVTLFYNAVAVNDWSGRHWNTNAIIAHIRLFKIVTIKIVFKWSIIIHVFFIGLWGRKKTILNNIFGSITPQGPNATGWNSPTPFDTLSAEHPHTRTTAILLVYPVGVIKPFLNNYDSSTYS